MNPDAQAPLAQTVEALSNKVRHLRASARMRAVIEQAKGILVERDGITLDEAFQRLRKMSQDHNVRLVEVAATVVGVTIPAPLQSQADENDQILRHELPASPSSSGTWQLLREQPDVKAGVVSAIMDSLATSTEHGDDAAELLHELVSPHGVQALVLYRAGADGSLRLVGQHGLPGDIVSSWRMIPPSPNMPHVRAIQENQSLFWGTLGARVAEFPWLASRSGTSAWQAAAVVPVTDGPVTLGVVSLLWTDEQVFDDVRTDAITSSVARVAPVLMRNLEAADPELDWLDALLRLHLDPWLLMQAVIGEDGRVRDFVVQDASPQIADSVSWIGRRLLEIWPELAADGTHSGMVELMRFGGSWSTTVAASSQAPWGIPATVIRAVRLGHRVAMVWRPAGG